MRECTAKIHECRCVAAFVGEYMITMIDGRDRCRRKAECTLAVRSSVGDHLALMLGSRAAFLEALTLMVLYSSANLQGLLFFGMRSEEAGLISVSPA